MKFLCLFFDVNVNVVPVRAAISWKSIELFVKSKELGNQPNAPILNEIWKEGDMLCLFVYLVFGAFAMFDCMFWLFICM